MKKQLRENAERYLQKATEDENLLKAVLNITEVSDEIFGFHAQQAIEKILKAVLTICDIRVGKVHDLRRLIDDCANAGQTIPSTLTKIELLTPYGVVGRYEDVPFKHPFTRGELQELIRQLRSWAEERVRR
jgi:HEPN domain-containing protein